MKRLALVLALALPFLVACDDDGRTCLRGHDESRLITIWHHTANGGMYPTYIPGTKFVCDEYAPEVAE